MAKSKLERRTVTKFPWTKLCFRNCHIIVPSSSSPGSLEVMIVDIYWRWKSQTDKWLTEGRVTRRLTPREGHNSSGVTWPRVTLWLVTGPHTGLWLADNSIPLISSSRRVNKQMNTSRQYPWAACVLCTQCNIGTINQNHKLGGTRRCPGRCPVMVSWPSRSIKTILVNTRGVITWCIGETANQRTLCEAIDQ